jgi:hypothetical protein
MKDPQEIDELFSTMSSTMRAAAGTAVGDGYRPPVRTSREQIVDDIGTAVAWAIGLVLLLGMLAVCAYAVRYGWEAGA